MGEVAELKDQLKSQKSFLERRLLSRGEGGGHNGGGELVDEAGAFEGAAPAAAEGVGGDGGGTGSRGGSRGSTGVTPSKRGPGTPGEAQRRHLEATQAAALANAESRHQEIKDKLNKRNNEFRAAQEVGCRGPLPRHLAPCTLAKPLRRRFPPRRRWGSTSERKEGSRLRASLHSWF